MPTGYTAGVSDGTIKTFKEFALRCARAFGATISMRDDPLDTPIPDSFKADSYYATNLDEARASFKRLTEMSEAEIECEANKDYKRELAAYKEREAERALTKQRYEKMLQEAQAWAPPSSEHNGLKEFMVSQLSESIEFDCKVIFDPPKKLTNAEWLKRATDQALSDIAYYSKEYAAEVERARGRSEWIRKLRESI